MATKKSQTLSDYLKSRDINFPQPQVDLFQEGEAGAEALKNAAQAWSSNEAGIRAVIEHRVGKIRAELLLKASPEEVIVNIDEFIIEDFETISVTKNEDNFIPRTAENGELVKKASKKYILHANKKKFIIHIGGGEPTLWKDLIPFSKSIKDKFNCSISITTNGSRSIRWWKHNSKFLDHVSISVHHESVDPTHISKVGDILYKNRVALWCLVLMDPNCWKKCLDLIDILKKSKYQWSINARPIFHPDIKYSEEQKKFLETKTRHPGLLYNLFVEKLKEPKYIGPTVYFKNFTKKVKENWLVINGYNNFKGWSCNVGVETLFIGKTGNIQGICGNLLYQKDYFYNIYEDNFKNKFNPDIIPTTCQTDVCHCQPEVNCSKSSNLIQLVQAE